MYIFMNEVAQAMEQTMTTNSAVYFNVELGRVEKLAQPNCIQLPSINPCDVIGAYLEYANDINLKRSFTGLSEADKKSFDAFSALAKEAGLRKDWESFKNADLLRIAHEWCMENSLNLKTVETPA